MQVGATPRFGGTQAERLSPHLYQDVDRCAGLHAHTRRWILPDDQAGAVSASASNDNNAKVGVGHACHCDAFTQSNNVRNRNTMTPVELQPRRARSSAANRAKAKN